MKFKIIIKNYYNLFKYINLNKNEIKIILFK